MIRANLEAEHEALEKRSSKMNIKGLYFKLNMDKEADKMIHDFFIQESKKFGCNKIDLLFRLICIYKDEDWRKTYD